MTAKSAPTASGVARTIAGRRARVREICLALPEATGTDHQHMKFVVRAKTFAYYLNDHHGDGIIAVSCRTAPGDQDVLLRMDPERYLMPAYLGSRGWISLRIDGRDIDWGEVTTLLTDSYRLVAPKRLAAQVGAL